jgi:hypothetical protein
VNSETSKNSDVSLFTMSEFSDVANNATSEKFFFFAKNLKKKIQIYSLKSKKFFFFFLSLLSKKLKKKFDFSNFDFKKNSNFDFSFSYFFFFLSLFLGTYH